MCIIGKEHPTGSMHLIFLNYVFNLIRESRKTIDFYKIDLITEISVVRNIINIAVTFYQITSLSNLHVLSDNYFNSSII